MIESAAVKENTCFTYLICLKRCRLKDTIELFLKCRGFLGYLAKRKYSPTLLGPRLNFCNQKQIPLLKSPIVLMMRQPMWKLKLLKSPMFLLPNHHHHTNIIIMKYEFMMVMTIILWWWWCDAKIRYTCGSFIFRHEEIHFTFEFCIFTSFIVLVIVDGYRLFFTQRFLFN